MTMQTFRRIGQVALHQRIVEQPGNAFQTEIEIFIAMNARQIVDE